MQRFITILFLLSCHVFPYSNTQAADFIPVEIGRHTTRQMNGIVSNTFMSDEAINMDFELYIPPEDRGVQRPLFLVALYQGSLYMKTAAGFWTPWDGKRDSLEPYKQAVLAEKEKLGVLSGEKLYPGEYLVFAGYLAAAGNILYSSTPATLAVFDQGSSALHRVQNKEMLNEFLTLGSIPNSGPQPAFTEDDNLADKPTSISQTNLQEMGVDEADRIKTNGNVLFTLERCPDLKGECLAAYEMTESPASTRKLGQISLNTSMANGQIYLYHPTDSETFILWLSHSFNSPVIDTAEIFPYPGNSKTEIKYIDASVPGAMKVLRSLAIDGSLVSSRLLENTLYLVTREEPAFFPGPVPLNGTAEGNARTTQLDSPLPSITFEGSEPAPLVEPTDCFIPVQNSLKIYDSRLVTITAIPIDNPENYESFCIAGTMETVYASIRALYLATSRYANRIQGNMIIYDPNPNYQTDIHKFSFSEKGLDYRGSGQAPGHLGWELDKRSFRMGEYENTLRVATSLGETWNDTSRTRVAVLQEDSRLKKLKEIGHLDNLGKPGEKLYAARFLGTRGYLVTFKVTDPLILLDLSNPKSPKIIGELEINGYSDYLHPIGENFLLGIGKDAVPDPDETRGAWYQGVKLSLFDVSDEKKLKEINSIILGKRGTSSAALVDHHAVSWLPASAGTTATLAIPVDLHDTPYSTSQFDPGNPSTFYDWTHTGLYTFAINTSGSPGITLEARLITDSKAANDQRNFNSLNDRSVIQGNSVHYIHNDAVFSSGIDHLK